MDKDFVKNYKLHSPLGEETIYRWVDDIEGIVRIKDMNTSFILKEIDYIRSRELKGDTYFNGAISVFEDVLLQRRIKKIGKIK